MFAGGNQRSDGFGKIERVDFVEGEVAVLQLVKKFGVGTTAGAEWFKGNGARAAGA